MNKKLLALFSVLFLCFLAMSFQYIEVLKLEIVKAYDATKPINGHDWSEMQCTEGLCVTTDNKVGIGTSTPAQKLEVAGSILVSGTDADVCTSSGACLSQIASFVSSQPLLNTTHNYSACTSAGGEIVSIGASYPICRFSAASNASCPSGWTQYQTWATYSSYSTTLAPCATCTCSAAGLAWGNNGTPSFSCTCCASAGPCGSDGDWCSSTSWTADSVRTQIGCY